MVFLKNIQAKIKGIDDTSIAVLAGVLSSVSFLISALLSQNFNIASAILLILTGLFLYDCFALNKGSFFEIRGIYSVVWLASIGLACLRLNINQKPWVPMTWVCLWLSYFTFILGYFVCSRFALRKLRGFKPRPLKARFLARVENREAALFTAVILLFILTFGSFIVEVLKLRYIPLFSDSMSAYTNFHLSGFHYFTVSAIFVFPFAYYYIRIYKPERIKKIFLIVLSLIASLVPIFIVSRKLFLLEVIIGMLVIAATGKKNEIVSIVLSGLIMLTGYGIISIARQQNTQYLTQVFNTTRVSQSSAVVQTASSQSPDKESAISQSSSESSVSQSASSDKSNIKLPPGYTTTKASQPLPMVLYQPYMYVTFNFDNFNYFLIHHQGYVYGKNIFSPIIYLTPLKNFFPSLITIHQYRSNPYLNTFPLCYSIYYDFGLIGLILYMFIIGFICCWIALIAQTSIIGILFEAMFKYALMISFFSNSFANQTMGFYYALLLIIALFMAYRVRLRAHIA